VPEAVSRDAASQEQGFTTGKPFEVGTPRDRPEAETSRPRGPDAAETAVT